MATLSQIKNNTKWNESATTLNENFNKINVELKKLSSMTVNNLGYYKSESDLPLNVMDNSVAYINETLNPPFSIWVFKNGKWQDSGFTYTQQIQLGDYYTRTECDEKNAEIHRQITGDSATNSNGFEYPFVFLGNFADYTGLIAELDKLHSTDNTSQTVGDFRVAMNGNLLYVTNYVRSWADEEFIQYIEGTIKLSEDGSLSITTEVNKYTRKYSEGVWSEWTVDDSLYVTQKQFEKLEDCLGKQDGLIIYYDSRNTVPLRLIQDALCDLYIDAKQGIITKSDNIGAIAITSDAEGEYILGLYSCDSEGNYVTPVVGLSFGFTTELLNSDKDFDVIKSVNNQGAFIVNIKALKDICDNYLAQRMYIVLNKVIATNNYTLLGQFVKEGKYSIVDIVNSKTTALETSLKEDIEEVEAILKEDIESKTSVKVDKQFSTNLLDVSKVDWGKYYFAGGNPGTVEDNKYASYRVDDIKDGLYTTPIGTAGQGLASYAVYGENGKLIRAVDGNIYNYQEGDHHVFISWNTIDDKFFSEAHPEARINKGSEELPYEPYTDYYPVVQLEKEVKKLETTLNSKTTALENDLDLSIETLDSSKLDKQAGVNLLNQYRVDWGKFYWNYGSLGTNDNYASYKVTDIKDGLYATRVGTYNQALASFAVFGENNELIRVVDGNIYEYEEGDSYVITSYFTQNNRNWFVENKVQINKGTVELPYATYTDYAPLAELSKRVDNLENSGSTGIFDYELYDNPTIYCVKNDLSNGKGLNVQQFLYPEHFLYNTQTFKDEDYDIGFTSAKNTKLLVANPKDAGESSVKSTICCGNKVIEVNYSKVTTLASTGIDKTPRVATLGDSVGDGYGANANRTDAKLPLRFWAWTAWFFLNDGSKYIGIGMPKNYLGINNIGTKEDVLVGDETFSIYANVQGGWKIEEISYPAQGDDPNTPEIEGDNFKNPFYNPKTSKFSLEYYLRSYRTMDDKGNRLYFDAEKATTGVAGDSNMAYLKDGSLAKYSDGSQIYIGSLVTNTLISDVCEPTHFVVNLNHNSQDSKYKENAQFLIDDVHKVCPDCIIILMTLDAAFTYSPSKYPNYDSTDVIGGWSLHNKNLKIYAIQKELAEENENVVVCAAHYVQPTAEGFPTLECYSSNNLSVQNATQNSNSGIGGPAYHPNNRAHAALGYQLYACIKSTLVE